MNIRNVVGFILLLCLIGLQGSAKSKKKFKSREVYKSEVLIITQIEENTFVHTSYKQTNDFGYVPCNGLIVSNLGEIIIFDTPTNDQGSEELIQFVQSKLHGKINAVIPTHFHDDCLGGLKAFHKHQISSFAHIKTKELASDNKSEVPQNGFKDSLVLKLGEQQVVVRYFGEGHTVDNVVGYFSSDHVLFGGCLIKEVGAGKGYLEDANVMAWSNTLEKVKKAYPDVKIVVPGHGQYGGKKLLDFTIKLFRIY